TTILIMISGFYHPDTGRIVLEGRDITDLAPSRIAELGIARTFQNIALFRGMTVLDNLLLGRHVHMKTGVLSAFAYWGLAQKEEVAHRKRVEEIIDFLRIQDLRRRPTGSLAYGLQKRVELGRARPPRPTGDPREGSRHLADLDVASVPRRGPRLRARPGRPRLQARRAAVGHRRQPAAALLGPGRRPVPGRSAGARLSGLDREGA